jgi:hypothetical protein
MSTTAIDNTSVLQRLVGISLVQCVASAVMAPLLLYLTRKLSLLWRSRLHNRLSTLNIGEDAALVFECACNGELSAW